MVAVDAQLPRIVDLLVRERSLDHDLQAAAEALIVLASAIGSHDRPGTGHGERVASRAVQIGRALGLDDSTRMTIRLGALLRDVGNARVPAAILAKSGELSLEERAMLGVIRSSARDPRRIQAASGLLPIVRHHHESSTGRATPTAFAPSRSHWRRIVQRRDRFEALLADRADRPRYPSLKLSEFCRARWRAVRSTRRSSPPQPRSCAPEATLMADTIRVVIATTSGSLR